VRVTNELSIAAPAPRVFDVLRRAEYWPLWYPNAKWLWIRAERSQDPDELTLGTPIVWKTMGVVVWSCIDQFDPPYVLAWRAQTLLHTRIEHTWHIRATEDGCRVRTTERQWGILPSVGRWFIRPLMHNAHQLWLEDLRNRVESSASSSGVVGSQQPSDEPRPELD
jgi:hypothetical protein